MKVLHTESSINWGDQKCRIQMIGERADAAVFDISRRTQHLKVGHAEFEIPHDHALVTVVGMLRGDKTQEHLIHAAAEMKRRGQPVTVFILGAVTNTQRTYGDELQALAGALGANGLARFAGYRGDVARLAQGADILAITSAAAEAQSRIAPQGFASLMPGVASNMDGVADLVLPGETGWLVAPGGAVAYADAFAENLGAPDRTAGVPARARTLTETSLCIDAKMAETLAGYENLIEHHRRKGSAP